MISLLAIGLIISVVQVLGDSSKVNDVFAWDTVDYAWKKPEDRRAAVRSGEYIPGNNMPMGIDVWRDKLFITVPRYKPGVVSSLNYVKIDSAFKEKNNAEPPPSPAAPLLIPYPDFKTNQLKYNDPLQITNVFRVRVDACDRLWMVDFGKADTLGTRTEYMTPKIIIYDLRTDKLIRQYLLVGKDLEEDSFFTNIVVDVTADKCDKAFAYLPDIEGHALVVYDYARNVSWRPDHLFFHYNPLAGNLFIGGVNVHWCDGLLSIALTKPNPDGYRTAYFHSQSSTYEFKVSTKVLQNPDWKHYNFYDFKIVGDRGNNTQSSTHFIHEETGVMFYSQLQKNSVDCWDTNKRFKPWNLVEVASDNDTMIFVSDVKVDYEDNLWFISNKLPIFTEEGIENDRVNFRIFRTSVDEAITGTNCMPWYGKK